MGGDRDWGVGGAARPGEGVLGCNPSHGPVLVPGVSPAPSHGPRPHAVLRARSHAPVPVHPLRPPPPLGTPVSPPCYPYPVPMSPVPPSGQFSTGGPTRRAGARFGVLTHEMGFGMFWCHPRAKGCAPMEQHCGTNRVGGRWPTSPLGGMGGFSDLLAFACAGDAPVPKPMSLPERHRRDAGVGGEDAGAFPMMLAGRCRSLGIRLYVVFPPHPPGVLPSPHPKHQWPHGCLVLSPSSGVPWEVGFTLFPPAV